jgi:hypothetical protein
VAGGPEQRDGGAQALFGLVEASKRRRGRRGEQPAERLQIRSPKPAQALCRLLEQRQRLCPPAGRVVKSADLQQRFSLALFTARSRGDLGCAFKDGFAGLALLVWRVQGGVPPGEVQQRRHGAGRITEGLIQLDRLPKLDSVGNLGRCGLADGSP